MLTVAGIETCSSERKCKCELHCLCDGELRCKCASESVSASESESSAAVCVRAAELQQGVCEQQCACTSSRAKCRVGCSVSFSRNVSASSSASVNCIVIVGLWHTPHPTRAGKPQAAMLDVGFAEVARAWA